MLMVSMATASIMNNNLCKKKIGRALHDIEHIVIFIE